MQTFMIPGTVFMSLLAGALFGQLRGVALVVFAASAGASSCFFLSKLIWKTTGVRAVARQAHYFSRSRLPKEEKSC
eukprot:UN04103